MTVADVLARIGKPSSFAARHRVAARDLHLDVAGIGPIHFPVSKATALALCRIARPARHGFKDQTVHDASVRDTRELAESKIKIERPLWDKALAPALARIGRDLGLFDREGTERTARQEGLAWLTRKSARAVQS